MHEVFSKHEGTGFVSNIEDNFSFINKYGRFNNFFYRSKLGDYTRKGGLRFAPSEAYNLISKEVSPIYANSNRDLVASDVTPWLESRFSTFFNKRAEIQNKSVFSHKYTGWSRMTFLKEIFPEAKFVHIIRDGRAVANSWLQMPWWGGYRGPENWLWGQLSEDDLEKWRSKDQSYPYLAGLSWKVLMDSFQAAEADFTSENYLRIKYEDILIHPKENFEMILSFSGLDWSRKFDKAFARQKIYQDRSNAYERDLNRHQLDHIEDCISELLAHYDYI